MAKNIVYEAIPCLSVWFRSEPVYQPEATSTNILVPAVMRGETYVSDGITKNGFIHFIEPREGWSSSKYWKKVGEQEDEEEEIELEEEPEPPSVGYTDPENTDQAIDRTITGDSDSDYQTLYWRYIRSFGCPPQYNDKVDKQYMQSKAPSCGRVFAKTMLAHPTILSICPGTVDYLPGFSSEQKDEFYRSVLDLASGDSSLRSRLQKDKNTNNLNGQLYKFKSAHTAYSHIVNLLCRTCAIFMGIGDETIPWGTKSLKHFDYAYWTNPDKEPHNTPSHTSVFGTMVDDIAREVTTAVSDAHYVHFFLTENGTSVDESSRTSTSASMLEEMVNGSQLHQIGRNLEYLFGAPIGSIEKSDDIESDINAIFNGGNTKSGFLSNIGKIAANYLKGGRMVFPQMVDNVEFDKSISCTCKFVSPYGDLKSIFLRCVVPICHLMAFALPKQLSQNMYTYPFLVRAFQKGHFNCDLGVMSGLTLKRGGSDDTGWSVHGMATEWEASFDIIPLYSQLMVSSTANPFLYLQNTSLIEYLATICGCDLKANNLSVKLDIAKTMINNQFSDRPTELWRGLAEGVASLADGILQFQGF